MGGAAAHAHPLRSHEREHLLLPFKAVACRPQERNLGVENDMYRYTAKQFSETSLALESLHKAPVLQEGEDARRNTSTQVDTTGSQHFKGEIACFRTQDRDEGVDGGNAKFIGGVFSECRIEYDWREIACRRQSPG